MNRLISSFLVTAFFVPSAIFAGVIRIEESNFTSDAGLITFSEIAFDSENPIYTPEMYGAESNGVTVSFGAYFIGQSIGGSLPGANPSGVIVGTPVSDLTLDLTGPGTFITQDAANPTSPVLSGTPTFNGAISMLFNKDIAGVGLNGGFFDTIGGTAITAFNRQGEIIGQVLNEGLGIEFLGLVTEDNTNQIAGLQFSLVGSEPAGYAIDNLRFGFADQIDIPSVPEPATISLLGFGLFSLGLFGFKRNKK